MPNLIDIQRENEVGGGTRMWKIVKKALNLKIYLLFRQIYAIMMPSKYDLLCHQKKSLDTLKVIPRRNFTKRMQKM